VRTGHWTALRRSVYTVTEHLPPDGPQRVALDVAAAQLACAHEVVGSHETAALVHGLPLFHAYDGPPLLSRVRVREAARPGLSSPTALVSQVPRHHRTTIHGAVVTTPARTAVDLARKGPALSATVVLDGVLGAGVTRQELEEVLADCRGWPGAKRAAGWVAFADGRAESPLESVGRWRMHQAELPPPDLQVLVRDVDGPIGRADFAWEELRTIAEADGFGKYRAGDGTGDFAALRAEKLREDRLRDAGFEVFRFTWEEAVHRPVVLEMRARCAFARAARRTG
jgi:alkylhydroperoxidase family enzyme